METNLRHPDSVLESGGNSLPPPLDMNLLLEKAKAMTPEQIRVKLGKINERIQLGGHTHEIKVAIDPSIHTWACCRIPKEEAIKGEIVRESGQYLYIIIMPFEHIAIEDDAVILGELRHEVGHALYTDWKLLKTLGEWVKAQGYPQEAMGSLLNCLEDPRMEHVSVYPLSREGYVRQLFWAKNKALILGNIGRGIASMHPVSQFDFIIKLYSLWALHAKNAEEEKIDVWDGFEDLHPDVLAAWEKIRPAIEKVVGVGAATVPEMRSYLIEESVRKLIWPHKKELIDKYGVQLVEDPPPGRPGGEPGKPPPPGGEPPPPGGEPPPPGGEPPPPGGEPPPPGGEPPPPGTPRRPGTPVEPHNQPRDPNDPTLSPEERELLKKLIDEYKKKIDEEAKGQIEQIRKAEEENKKIEKERDKRFAKVDGLDSNEVRKKYNELSREAAVVKRGMSRLFEKYFPKIAYPKDTFGRRGKEYDHREHLKRFGSGFEKPMATPNIPEKSGFVLQIIVDVSASMNGSRIEKVIQTVVGILEAAQDYPIHIEVLASDDKHGGIDERYILKSFNEEFDGATGGKIKERLVGALTSFGGDNKDAASLRWAVPRVIKERERLRADYENISALVVFLSDASVPGQQDPNVVNQLRKKVPILGGVIEPDPLIKECVQLAYGPVGEGSFCPDTLAHLSNAFEKVIRKTIRKMFAK